jgi:hypothetical protein
MEFACRMRGREKGIDSERREVRGWRVHMCVGSARRTIQHQKKEVQQD